MKFSNRVIFLIIAIFSIFIANCNYSGGNKISVMFHIQYGYSKKFYLERVGINDEKSKIIDSGVAKSGYDSIPFFISSSEEGLYIIKSPDNNMSLMFINDSKKINVYARYDKPFDYSVINSPASASLKKFISQQDSIANKQRLFAKYVDSLKRNNVPTLIIDSLNKKLNNDLQYFFAQYKNYADTVASPAAFLAVFNNIDFGKNFEQQKLFITQAAKKFSSNKSIQKLKEKTLNYLKIFEEEYNIGDKLPSIELPDINSNKFSTNSLNGKYYLIDFWSTWCEPCYSYFSKKENAFSIFSDKNFQIVSVALDNQKEEWKKIVSNPKLQWHQLIDTNMWEGETVRKLKFDSIPFNFLISPDGKILAKAIKPDSLINTIRKFVNPIN